MKFTLLGTGTTVPDVERGPTGFLLQAGGAALLIDGGSGTLQRLKKAGVDARDLDGAVHSAKASLAAGCEAHFDGYMDQLLEVAAGDPDPGNRQVFSEFLVWTSDSGLLSKRQAQETWNRYFNVKYVSLQGDYNNCALTCPVREQVLDSMEDELADKEWRVNRWRRWEWLDDNVDGAGQGVQPHP